jgi:FKBP-type peptidyl-prolyl cis-trans isomerase FkpA
MEGARIEYGGMLMRSRFLVVLLLGGIAAVASPQAPEGQEPRPSPAAPPSATLASDETAIYAVGFSIWRGLAPLDLSPAEVEILKRGLDDAIEGRPEISMKEMAPKVEALRRARAQRAAEKEKAASAAYLEKAEKEPGAIKTPSGLVFFDLRPGSGDSPLIDGTEFDSSYHRLAQFPLNEVIPCWTEGVQKMKVGGKARLLCPSSIAYGDRGQSRDPRRPSIPGGAMLMYEVELIEIVKPAPSRAALSPSLKTPSPAPSGSSR